MMAEVYLGLGSNMGDREKYLIHAIKLISDNPYIELKRFSGIYETAPVGYVQQDSFLNMVVVVETDMTPYDLLAFTQEVESKLKRVRNIRWGPRTIDIDILLFGEEVINEERLTVPHREIFNRAFVLVPLMEVYPYPLLIGKDLNILVSETHDLKDVRLYKEKCNITV